MTQMSVPLSGGFNASVPTSGPASGMSFGGGSSGFGQGGIFNKLMGGIGKMDFDDWGSMFDMGKGIYDMYGMNKMMGLYEDKLESDQDYASLTAYNTATLTDEARANQSAQGMNMQNPGSGNWDHLSDPAPIRYSV